MASTVIGAGITIEGEVTSDEDVVVQGTLRGKLVAKDAVTVEHGGVVEADITAGPVAVARPGRPEPGSSKTRSSLTVTRI